MAQLKLNAPSNIVWLIAVIVGTLGLLAQFVPMGELSVYSFWMVAIGFILLTLATLLRGM